MRTWAPFLIVAATIVAGRAEAQPVKTVQIGGQTWQQTVRTGVDTFTRADGTTVEIAITPVSCSKLPRPAEAVRYGWVPRVYWPKLDTSGGKVVLCLAGVTGAATVTVIPGSGRQVNGDVAAFLEALATEARPPSDLPAIGRIHPSLPVGAASGDNLTFVVDGTAVGIGLSLADRGTCAYENAIVLTSLGKAANTGFADGYWQTVVEAKGALYGCLELREGYITLIVNPASQITVIGDVLAEIRRAAYAKQGAPLSFETGAMVLPRSGQQVAAVTGNGKWKAVDGERFKRPGSDVLVSISAFGSMTMYSVGVGEGPCTPGTTTLPPTRASPLFPAGLGTVWIDSAPYKLRWVAWACVTHKGETATISVIGPIARDKPPDGNDLPLLRALVDQVARAYGVEPPITMVRAAPTPSRPYSPSPSRSRRGDYHAMGGAYGGILSIAPEIGDRRTGAMLGLDGRVAPSSGVGGVFAMSFEAGYGAGELQGGLRTAGGIGIGPLNATVGIGLGSIGPGAALDGYAELSLNLGFGRGTIWIGAQTAKGLAGPGHDQLELKLVIPGKGEDGVYLGARAMRFGVDEDTMLDTGTAVLVVIGAGVVSGRND